MSHNLTIGNRGEDIAVSYLKKNGFRILERNWRHMHREIDIIAICRDTIVVIEVKTRTGRSFGDPVADVTVKKQAFLVQAAEAYLFNHNLDMDVRFDIIVILSGQKMPILEHIKDAFHPVAE